MAVKNKIIRNLKTGHQTKFLQTAKDTNGELLEMEATYHAHSTEPVAHYHPFQEEDFTILEGTLTVRIDGELRILKPGDTLHIPVNKVHSMWNNGDGMTVVNWKVRPAMTTEYFLETATGLFNDDKANSQGKLPLLQTALLANKYGPVFRLAKPPYWVQRILFFILAPIGYLMGYRARYEEYLD